LKRANVYIIENEADICDEVVSILSEHNISALGFKNGESFFESWDGTLEGCLLLDMRLDGMSGFDVLEKIADATKILPVILFTSVLDMQLAVEATKNGVYDYCAKPFTTEHLVAKVTEALRVNAERRRLHAQHLSTLQAISRLTDREREILDHLCSGKSSKQIAEDLGISSFTVDNHRARIMNKMGANSVSQVIQLTLNARR
jgi:FixJ family two-component response regulator